MSEVIRFLIFWVVFLAFVYYIQYLGANTVISGFSPEAPSDWDSFLGIFDISSGYNWINWLLLLPFLVVLVYIIVCLARGVSP